jgi:hypothetical protein
MKKIILFTIILIFCNKVFSQNFESSSTSSSIYKSLASSYIYKDSLYNYDSKINLKKIPAQDLVHDSSLLHALIDSYSSTTIYNVDENGQLNILSNTAKRGKSTYKVIYEFSQTQPVKLKTRKEDSTAFVLSVGIAVRMVATIYSSSNDLDLSKISSFVSASTSKKKLNGFLEVKVLGIESKSITNLIPTPQTISTETIISALQAMAAIKSHFNDVDSRIIPHVVGYYTTKDENDKLIMSNSIMPR